MSRLIRAAVALAIAASAAGAARAQTGAPVDLSEMRPLLEAQARQVLSRMGGGCTPGGGGKSEGASDPVGQGGGQTPCKRQPPPTLTQLLSFMPVDFRLTDAPRVKYDLVPGYAHYAAHCQPATRALTPLNAPGGPRGPTTGYIPPTVLQVLPPAPALPGDTSAVFEVRRRTDLGVLAPPAQYANPIAVAWGEGASQGHYRGSSSKPVLPSGAEPRLGSGVLVVAVTPWFDLQDANYSALTVAGEAIVNGSQRVGIPPVGILPVTVRGQLKGGRWSQGSGLLFIPAPNAVPPGDCPTGQLVQPADAALLARFGIQPGRPFEYPGAVFVRTAAH